MKSPTNSNSSKTGAGPGLSGTGANQTSAPSKGSGQGDPNSNNRGRRRRNKGGPNSSQSKSRSPSHENELGTGAGTATATPQKGSPRNRNNNNNNNNNRKNQNKNKSSSPTRRQNTQSYSPVRRDNKSHSPIRRHHSNKCQGKHKNNSSQNQNHHNHHHHHQHNHYHQHGKKNGPPADMTVIVNRVDLWDHAANFQPEDKPFTYHHPEVPVGSYQFTTTPPTTSTGSTTCATVRVPYNLHEQLKHVPAALREGGHHFDVLDKSMPNPYDSSVCHDKYWAQRRRLFHRFDRGIQLDSEGWYSVTPEIIADHVARRVAEVSVSVRTSADPPQLPDDLSSPEMQKQLQQPGIVVLDAFSGCGGNAIAFGKMPFHLISKVVCCDTDRSKLMKAAHNASIYDIPVDKLVFVECNSIFILQHCYRNGEFHLDKPTETMPAHMPKPVMPRLVNGYPLGGLDLLPQRIHAVFMDPPWGGVDYEVLGKNGYDLFKNMKIQVGNGVEIEEEDEDGGLFDDFFDNFTSSAPKPKKQNAMSQKARRENFNKKTEGDFINGMELLKLAAEATADHVVIYDLPRNTNKTSLGKAALGAGYCGNIKLEEHHLNGRLKTVTAYLGADYSGLLPNHNATTTTPVPDKTATTAEEASS